MSSRGIIEPVVIRDLPRARDKWRMLQEHNVAPTPFCDWDVLVGLSEAFNWELCFVFWGDILASCFFIRSRMMTSDVVVPPFAPFTAVLLHLSVPEENRATTLSRIFDPIAGIPSSRVISFEPRLAAYVETIPGYSVRQVNTFHVASGPIKTVQTQFSESTRRLFSKSKEHYSLQFESVDLTELSNMVVDGYEAHNRSSPLGQDKLAKLATHLTNGCETLTLGLNHIKSGRLEAGIVFLIGDHTAWYWMAGSKRGPAMTVLVARSLEILYEKGIATLDFMGANTEGITEFKRRFGGQLIGYRHFSKQNWRNWFISKVRSLT